ncbi:MAG: RDD family protein [Gemmobacter sp.]
MTAFPDALPDPGFQPEFYTGVPTKRLLAWVVDSLLIGALTLLALPLSGFLGVFVLPGLFLTVGLVYRSVTIAKHSATPGMRLMAIEFRDSRGRRFEPVMAFLHSTGFTFSCVAFPVQILSVGLMLTGARAQGLTDHLLGTAAINRPAEV